MRLRKTTRGSDYVEIGPQLAVTSLHLFRLSTSREPRLNCQCLSLCPHYFVFMHIFVNMFANRINTHTLP